MARVIALICAVDSAVGAFHFRISDKDSWTLCRKVPLCFFGCLSVLLWHQTVCAHKPALSVRLGVQGHYNDVTSEVWADSCFLRRFPTVNQFHFLRSWHWKIASALVDSEVDGYEVWFLLTSSLLLWSPDIRVLRIFILSYIYVYTLNDVTIYYIYIMFICIFGL